MHFQKKNNGLIERLLGSFGALKFFVLVCVFFSLVGLALAASPTAPSSVGVVANETSLSTNGTMINISGGYIATLRINATTQNTRWKAFVGNVTGSLNLADAVGAQIYDWSLTTISGEVYATRNASTIGWTNMNCSNISRLEIENGLMNHTSPDDNISKTFSDTTHAAFTVGSSSIYANTCRTLNTYINNASQNTDFEEIALYDTFGSNIVYATILEQDVAGFDGHSYDFQMIVPEIGLSTFTGATAYYLYVELT